MKKKKAARRATVSRTPAITDEVIFSQLEAGLPRALPRYRWFGGKSKQIRSVSVEEKLSLPLKKREARLVLFRVEYTDGTEDCYFLPILVAPSTRALAASLKRNHPKAIITTIHHKGRNWLVYDGTVDADFRAEFLQMILHGRQLSGRLGDITPSMTCSFRRIPSSLKGRSLASAILKGEQSNTSIPYGKRFMLKLFRRVEEGVNPDVEIGRFLTDFTRFANAPQSVGALEYVRPEHEPITLASLQTFVPSKGDAWRVFMNLLAPYCRKLLRTAARTPAPALPKRSILDLVQDPIPASVSKPLQPFLSMVELLGRRTMEMHLALTAPPAGAPNVHFTPEPFSFSHQHDLHQSLRKQIGSTFACLRTTLETLPRSIHDPAWRLLGSEKAIHTRFDALLNREIEALRTRTHGDYHLGQVLYTGKDFVIIDFEGEPARTLAERKIKRSPLRDVAGMLRSFHYASHVAMSDFSPQEVRTLEPHLAHWHFWVCVAYLRGYFSLQDRASFLPSNSETTRLLLDIYLLEKALYELVYEINNRPTWVKVPLTGILDLLEAKT